MEEEEKIREVLEAIKDRSIILANVSEVESDLREKCRSLKCVKAVIDMHRSIQPTLPTIKKLSIEMNMCKNHLPSTLRPAIEREYLLQTPATLIHSVFGKNFLTSALDVEDPAYFPKKRQENNLMSKVYFRYIIGLVKIDYGHGNMVPAYSEIFKTPESLVTSH
jgi:hypothetical protein